jgi:lipoprotein-anchoring transpeptidase ErfK/SrfK
VKLPQITKYKLFLPIIGLLGVSLVAGGLIGTFNGGASEASASETIASETYIAENAAPTEAPLATPSPTPTQTLSPAPSATPLATPAATPKPKKPKPATRDRKAKNVPEMPRDKKNAGRRIVYDKSMMYVWAMNKKNEVVYRFPIVGRWDRPVKGNYRIYSKSDRSGNPNSKVTFDHMTRFAYGNDGKTPIGFHSIPKYYDGSMMHSTEQLGLPIATGGCIRMAAEDAEKLYKWSKIGDLVVVLPSP